jgi:hypothetical protein
MPQEVRDGGEYPTHLPLDEYRGYWKKARNPASQEHSVSRNA